MTERLLSFSHVAVHRGKKEILHDISFSLQSGTVTSLIGRNGSGKTTLLRTAMGLLRHKGEISLRDTPLRALSPRVRSAEIGLFPQFLTASPLSVEEFVLLGCTTRAPLFSAPSENDRRCAHEALIKTSLTPFATRPLSSLSGGELRRAYLALLLAQAPSLCLMDEPTAFLDAAARKSFYALVRAQVTEDKSKSVLAVLHDVSDALTLSDRVLVLDDGALVFDGTPTECIENKIPERFFGLVRHTSQETGQCFFA